jgi:DNA replication and repair protein RecF
VISSLHLQNFRSYLDASFEFDAGTNIIVGPNASGKTNLLEAILFSARGSSYRAKDTELVHHKRAWARLDSFFDSSERTVKLIQEDGRVAKTFEIGGKTYHRLRLERTVPAVFFEPNHLQLVTRGPEQRREYFDELLERTQVEFKSQAAAYRRALAQRNRLLKQGPESAQSQLFAWNVRLSELGGKIAQARQQLIDDINKDISKTYSGIAGKRSRVKLHYDSHFPAERYSSRLLAKLEATIGADLERGFTAYGPHRDDIIFYLNDRPVGETASRGESRSLVLALKIFELGLVEKIQNHTAIFLLDDVFSELDGARRRALVDYLKDRQVIITTTDAEAVIEYFNKGQRVIALG